MAVNCWVRPAAIDGLDGVTAMDTSVEGAVTLSIAEPPMGPALAVIVVVPAPAGAVSPWLPPSLLIAATVPSEELHVADAKVCVLLSPKAPIAINC